MTPPRAAKRRQQLNTAIRTLLPLASLKSHQAVLGVAEQGHLRHLPPAIAAWQAATTIARHEHTEYDQLLAEGYEADAARHFVLDDINRQLEAWGCARRINAGE